MDERDKRLAAAKRKLQEYKAQHRLETEKLSKSVEDSHSDIQDTLTPTPSQEIKTIPPIVSSPISPSQIDGAVTLTIDEESESTSAVEMAQEATPSIIPQIPSLIEFPGDSIEIPELLPPLNHNFNQSSETEGNESTTNTNTNTSPIVTPTSQSERAADVRHWVENDNLAKSLHQDEKPPVESPTESHTPPSSTNENSSLSRAQEHIGYHQHQKKIDEPAAEEYELELTQLRKDNVHLQKRERELVTQLHDVEKIIQTVSQERENLKQELRTELTPLKQKFTRMCDENTELKVVISNLRTQLNSTLQESEVKKKTYDDMEAAFIKISNFKRELESNFDIETERATVLEVDLKEKILQNKELIQETARLAQNEMKFDSVLHSREEEIKLLQTRITKLEKQLHDSSAVKPHSLEQKHVSHDVSHQPQIFPAAPSAPIEDSKSTFSNFEPQFQTQARRRMDSIEETEEEHAHEDCAEHDHAHDHAHEHENHSHQDAHEHKHHEHGHAHGQDHDDHGHGHDHHDHHHGAGDNEHENHHNVIKPSPDGPTPMQKKLARLEWENLTYREELDKLAALLKANTVDLKTFEAFQEENGRLRSELNRLEHLVIQLQGENDTIADYISLYQTQKMVLREKVQANDREMETLSQERAELRSKMEELNILLTNYNTTTEEQPVQKINELITSINNSSATLANFHPCSVCSGNLMNV